MEAAAVPVVFLTAWYACARAQVSAQDRVVVTAASGGVGTALLQVLRERGAKTLALVGSESKTAHVPRARRRRSRDVRREPASSSSEPSAGVRMS